jgi:hypothetical protein
MPKEITHCILAERAVHTLAAAASPDKHMVGREIVFMAERLPQLLYFGSVSPDIFFYDIKLPWELRVKHRGLLWGELIHGTHGEDSLAHVMVMLDTLRDERLQANINAGRAFSSEQRDGLLLLVMGYLSHVALDTVMHPIVYYFSGNYYAADRREKLRSEARHRAIETVLDLYNLAAIDSDLKKFRAKHKLALPEKWRELVLAFYTQAILQAFPEEAARQFGSFSPSDIRRHALYTVVRRCYKKQSRFNRLFQNAGIARSGLWYNRKRHDRLHFNSSLLYPAASYGAYLAKSKGDCFKISDLQSYRDPVSNREQSIRPEVRARRAFARSHAFFRAAFSYARGLSTREDARRVLKGYSLNNGGVGVPTQQMQYFSPLQIDGNFRYLSHAHPRSNA